jgi:hypothetical protein
LKLCPFLQQIIAIAEGDFLRPEFNVVLHPLGL